MEMGIMESGFLRNDAFELGARDADCSGRCRNADLRWRTCPRFGSRAAVPSSAPRGTFSRWEKGDSPLSHRERGLG